MVETGDVSVMPYAMVISWACISLTTRFMTSTGHGAPAMIPVRSDVRSRSAKWGDSSMAMNIVGTPYIEVHRSDAIASRVGSGVNDSAGYTIVAPEATQPRLPMPMPKQWYSGTGMHTRSASE